MSQGIKTGLVLSGGGARTAYQVGVLKALVEIAYEEGITQPFPVITGSSAGAINASYLAGNASDMLRGVRRLSVLWSRLTTHDVYRVDSLSLFKGAVRILTELVSGGFYREKRPFSLLDTTPLRELISREYSPDAIDQHVASGALDALAVRALDYTKGINTVFFQAHGDVKPWSRELRYGVRERITPDHVLASASLPIVFPPVKIGDHYFGDGSLRNYTPLSPAIKMGANQLMVISVRKSNDKQAASGKPVVASPGRILGLILNSVLLDAIEMDVERVSRINRTLGYLTPEADTPLKPVKLCLLSPSEDLGEIAKEEAPRMPRTIRYLVKGLGSRSESSDLISYLLFEPSYIRRIIALGYGDARDQRSSIVSFLTGAS